MSVLDTPENVPVQLGFCPCLGTPHPDGDIVYLSPLLTASQGVRAKSMLVEVLAGEATSDDVQERLTEVWLRTGVVAWTFLDDEGQTVPVTPANVVRALPYAKGGREVADKADDLYAQSVLAPLAAALGIPLPGGSPARSPRATSPRKRSTTPQPSPSSTATTVTAPPPE